MRERERERERVQGNLILVLFSGTGNIYIGRDKLHSNCLSELENKTKSN